MQDRDGVRHMGLIRDNEDLDVGDVFLICRGGWVDMTGYGKSDEHVTCIECAAFRVQEGKIKLWMP